MYERAIVSTVIIVTVAKGIAKMAA